MNYYIQSGESVQGPYSPDELRSRLATGSLSSSTAVCLEGTEHWEPLSSVLQSPSQPAASLPPPLPPLADRPDATGGIIPYKNPQALIGYYLGIFSLIPVFGFLLAIPAFILGILGLKQRKRHPMVGGRVHAWIGILLGGFSIIGHVILVVLVMAD